ncbi:MAG: carboxypeptidase M32 [Patescibacteria group bacterium]
MEKKQTEKLKERLTEIAYIASSVAVLNWDMETNMPPQGADARARSISHLSAVVHDKFVKINEDGLLTDLKRQVDEGVLSKNDTVIIRETWRSYERERKLPETFVKELSETVSRAQVVWASAREKSDFKLFLPWLEKIIKLKKQEAELIGFKNSPYDVSLDYHEPAMTAEKTSEVLNELKIFLIPFVAKIKNSKIKINPEILKGNFPTEKQTVFNKKVAQKIGFDFQSGRMDQSVHPFSTSFHPSDSRITTRYEKIDVLSSIGTTIHEVGHALYEQGLPARYFGTPLAESVSYGIHESQSRLWENMIGKSFAFWQYFYPQLKKDFPTPFKNLSLKEFYKTINCVRPSLIRVEADEVTYNLHIIMRFEIERDLIENKINAKDLPEIWNQKMKEYLGIKASNDKVGVLQDVHWSMGGVGYFPTYSLGNLYSAQFYNKMSKDIGNIDDQVGQGNFGEIINWLGKNIHSLGKTYTASNLVKKVTGEELNSKYFSDYLEKKYGEIYEI